MAAREAAQDESPKLHWIILDGPIDTFWIENMNSVLDESRKFCLSNGQIIKLTDRMRIFFEVDNLIDVNPAIISRTGIIYFDDKDILPHFIWKKWI